MPQAPLIDEADAALKKCAAQYRDWEESLKEQKKRLADLQAVEKEFLATRDMALLEEFKEKRAYPKAELAEEVKEPYALWQEDGWLAEVSHDLERLAIRQRMLAEQDADARLFNPHVKILHIKGKKEDGTIHTYRVYQEIDSKEFRAFCRLRDAEREAERKMDEMTPRPILNSPAYCPAAPSKSSKRELN